MLAVALRSLFLWLSDRRWLGRVAMATPVVRRMPFRFVAGTTLHDAVTVVRQLNDRGACATLDVLGESVDGRASAERAAAAYVDTVERIAAERLDANVSIKLTQMGLDLGVDECLAIMSPIAEAGTRLGIFIRIDMEGSGYVDRTFEVVDRLRAAGHDVGPVVQAYLHRAPADVGRLAGQRVRTRVCKGAYAEPSEVALQERAAISDAFLAMTERLLEADAYPGVATHDPELIQRVRRLTAERGIPPDRFEFQMLYGVRRDLQQRLLADGFRLRIYVPFGTEWYPYFMRRLAERPANVLFVLRSILGERGGPPAGRTP